jgi:hypothetical protein
MSEPNRDRGKLFEYAEKQKPSQPAFHGDCVIDGTAYEIRGWHREAQLAISLAAPRVDTNKYGNDLFRGNLDPAPPKPVAKGGKGKKGKSEPEPAGDPTPAWTGTIIGDETAYVVRAFEKQGKSGIYWTLSFEKTEKPARATTWDDSEPEATE